MNDRANVNPILSPPANRTSAAALTLEGLLRIWTILHGMPNPLSFTETFSTASLRSVTQTDTSPTFGVYPIAFLSRLSMARFNRSSSATICMATLDWCVHFYLFTGAVVLVVLIQFRRNYYSVTLNAVLN